MFQNSVADAMAQCTNLTLREKYAAKLVELGERLGLDQAEQKAAKQKAASLVLEAALHRAILSPSAKDQRSNEDESDVGIGIQALGTSGSGSASSLGFLTQIATAVQLYVANKMDELHDPQTTHLCKTMTPAERGNIYQNFVLSSLWLELNPNNDFPQEAVNQVAIRLPQILGLTPAATAKLRRNVGLQLVFRLCESALPKNNGQLDTAEAELIAKLEAALDADLSEAVVGAKKKLLLRGLDAAASTGASLADIRNLAVSMGLDVASPELGVTKDKLQFYFKTEARQVITDFFNNALTDEPSDIVESLTELSEAYELEIDTILPLLKQLCADHLDLAQAEFKAGNSAIAATHLMSLASCIDFADAPLDLVPHLWLTSTDRSALLTVLNAQGGSADLIAHITALFDSKQVKK
mmetsp:Transcript_10658/g.13233  ORF Transcript_10658/g.13233 Transcript_10658/m.13233 type:complete len:411 (+) Transcript_10658:1211-2443(+)